MGNIKNSHKDISKKETVRVCILSNSVTDGTSLGLVPSAGNATTLSRGDHIHGTPPKDIIPVSYIIYQEKNIIYAKSCMSGKRDYSGIVTDVTTTIQNAINNLTIGRTWKEKVTVKGSYIVNDTIKIPSYTALDIQGKLSLGKDVNLFESKSLTDESKYVEITGGFLDGVGHASYDGIKGIFSRSFISNMNIENFNNGINLTGVSWADYGTHRSYETCIFNNNIGLNNVGILLCPYSTDNEILSNVVRKSNIYGIQIQASNRIIGNHTWASAGDAQLANIYINTDGYGVDNLILDSNFIDGGPKDGIIIDASDETNTIYDIIISNNTFQKIGMSANNTYDCIRFQRKGNPGIGKSVIIGNRFVSYEANKPRYGINETCTTGNQIAFNRIVNMATLPIMPGDSNTIIKYNDGYKTENYGVLIANGTGYQKIFRVIHGLASVPMNVQLEAKSLDAAGNKYWSADAIDITVNFVTAPPSGINNIVISWKADV